MDFARPLECTDSVVTQSQIRYTHPPPPEEEEDELDRLLRLEANQAACDLFQVVKDPKEESSVVNYSQSYPERSIPRCPTIQEGDLVVIMESFDSLSFCYVKQGEAYHNRHGRFLHNDFIGKPYGCQVRSQDFKGYGFCYLLRPTPELWARSLPHRTQIVHELDASMICYYLNLKPNCQVVESGTGSGALSHAVMRSIAPHGHLYTFEFNVSRVESARDEFQKHGIGHLVTVQHKDVCGKQEAGGFDRPPSSIDAVILDLPEPWLAIEHAAFCLKRNSRLVSYSPCIEQVQKTLHTLRQEGFHSCTTMEFRLKEYHVGTAGEWAAPPPTAKRPPRPPSLRQLKASNTETTSATSTASPPVGSNDDNATVTTGDGSKRKRESGQEAARQNDLPISNRTTPATAEKESNTVPTENGESMIVTRPFASMRGHTAFLTFATNGNGGGKRKTAPK